MDIVKDIISPPIFLLEIEELLTSSGSSCSC